MHDNIPWQVFNRQSKVIDGKGAMRHEFDEDVSLIVGAAHVWIWRLNDQEEIEILFQKRSTSITTWSGYLDISAAGHIDLGEDPFDAAIRESKEELGITLDESKVICAFMLPRLRDRREFDWVYTYQVSGDISVVFDDGEVESIHWLNRSELNKAIENPEDSKIVPYGSLYFGLLLDTLQFQIKRV
jgi:8-oxo-dGTP pyrophosphatase MutT (NUDIX family)